jgi:hypothetical protein
MLLTRFEQLNYKGPMRPSRPHRIDETYVGRSDRIARTAWMDVLREMVASIDTTERWLSIHSPSRRTGMSDVLEAANLDHRAVREVRNTCCRVNGRLE